MKYKVEYYYAANESEGAADEKTVGTFEAESTEHACALAASHLDPGDTPYIPGLSRREWLLKCLSAHPVNEYTCSKCGAEATIENGAVVRTCECDAAVTVNLSAVVVGTAK